MTSATIPSTPQELEALLSDPARLQPILADREEFKRFIRAYASALNDQTDLKTLIAEEVARATREIGERNHMSAAELGRLRRLPMGGDATGDRWGRRWTTHVPDPGSQYNRRASGAAFDSQFESFGDFAKVIWHLSIARGADPRLKDMSSVIGSDGGFLVPELLRAELLRLSLETAIVRPRARVIPMEVPRIPFPVISDTSHASNVYGGITGTWTSESTALTESSPTFGRVWLDAKKLTAYTEVPNELISDSIISLEALLSQLFPEALAYFEDDAFLVGDGAGKPLGALNTGNLALITQAKETAQAAATIVWENIVKMYSRMLPPSLGRAVWLANIDTFPQLALMSLSVGTGGAAIWLNSGDQGPPMTILGRPVIFSEKVENLGDQGDISLVDFSYYLIGDRQQLTAASSPHFKFSNDQTVYRFIERVDGQPWLKSAITPRKSATTLSPFVTLAARA